MNRRRFTLVALIAIFVIMILLPTTIVPTLNTADGVLITQDEIDHFGETLPNNTLYYPDLGFPTTTYLPSAEGSISSESITSFSETTADNMLLYPDTNATLVHKDEGEDSTEWNLAGGVPNDPAYRGIASVSDGYDGSAIEIYAIFESTANEYQAYGYDVKAEYGGHGVSTDGQSMTIRWKTESASNHQIRIQTKAHDSAKTTFENVYVTSGSVSTSWTVSTQDLDSVYTDGYFIYSVWVWSDDNPISVASGNYSVYIDWITFHATSAMVDPESGAVLDTDGTGNSYQESFADVRDWTIDVSSGGATSVTSDGDILTMSEACVTTGNDYLRIEQYGLNIPQNSYVEFRFKTLNAFMRMQFYDGDLEEPTPCFEIYSADWTTVKFYLSGYVDAAVTGLEIQINDYSNSYTTGTTIYAYFDYLRIGPADEMGWQHDGSTTEGISSSDGGTIASDADAVTLTADGDGSTFIVVADTTTTASSVSCAYYPFFGIDINSGSGSWTLEQYNGSAYATLQSSVAISAGTKRFNMRALDTYVSQWKITLTASGVLVSDWLKAHSIANFTVSDLDDEEVTNAAYVDSDNHLIVTEAGDYIRFHYDPAISVTVATYNLWNVTVQSGSSGFRFREYTDTDNYFATGETRGVLTSTTLTAFQIIAYTGFEISAIKFWEDTAAPTISTFTNSPLDPNTASEVTVESIASDGFSIYTVEATAVVEPDGSSINTVSMTLDYTTHGGAGIYSYTFSAGDLTEGRYTFELEVDDGANQVYEYLTFTVRADTQTTYIRIFDSLGDFVPFETFEVYRNGTRQYTDVFLGDTESVYQIQVKDRWGETLNTTIFSAGAQELVVTVEVYSLKVMSWHYDFVRFNVTRAGLTYSEIVTPLEIINFRLYANTYNWEIDYLNGTSTSGDINLTNSTALIVTGATISDVLGLVTTIDTMTTAINITTTTISNEVVTVQLMFDWSNTTLYNQSINIIAAFNWDNTTLYNQTISIAAAFNATNTVLYDQIILIQNMFNWENTTLFNQTISILNAFNATNTVIYEQTISILADISNVNSTIYAQTVQMLLDLENSNSTLYSQTVTLLADISNVNSTLYAQTVTLLADIENVNSTLYAQTVTLLSDISNVNSTLYSQTVTLLSDISNTNSTIYAQTVTILSDITNVNSTIYSQTIDILNYVWNNATSIYNQTLTILTDISNTNSTLYSQTVSILTDVSNVNSTLFSQTLDILTDISNTNSTIYSQTLTILTNIENVNSTLYSQTIDILTDIQNTNSTLYAQTVQVLTDISNTNSTIYSQTITILSQIVNTNSTIYSQTLTILSNLSELNATVYLIDDPTHLNPLILGHSYSDDYCDLTIVTNWHNASISVYDNDVLRTGPTSELLCPIRYPLLSTSGTHNLSIYVDAGNDAFWYNISYTIAEIIAFEIEDWDVSPHLSTENYLECFFRTTWGNSTIYVYLNDTLQTSVLEQEGGISFSFWMSESSGLHQYVFNVTSGASVETITWDFYLPDWAETALVVRWDMWTYQNNYTLLTLESNWRNCTYHVYLNGSEVANATVDPVTLNFTRAINFGEYNLTIFADGGTQNYTILNIRYIVTEEGVTYDYSEVTTSHGVANAYETNNFVTYENPTGFYASAETIAMIIVGILLGAVLAYMIVSRWLAVWQAKFSAKYT